MVASKRDRTIVLGAAGLLVVFYFYVADPLLARVRQLRGDVSAREQTLATVNTLLANDKRMKKTWSDMLAAGLKDEPSRAGIQAGNAVGDWAREADLHLDSVKSERTEPDKYYQRVMVRASASGSMASLARFLWRVQTASIPVRITDIAISSRKDATDDLSVQIGFSTLCSVAEGPRVARPDPTAPSKEEP